MEMNSQSLTYKSKNVIVVILPKWFIFVTSGIAFKNEINKDDLLGLQY